MQSTAHKRYLIALRAGRRLSVIATDRRLRPVKYEEAEPALHAALASYVSAWEVYVENSTTEFVQKLQASLTTEGSAVATILLAEASMAKSKFNTPNYENSRDLFLRFTGVDTYPVMASHRLALSGPQTRDRLNEILKVRHSFAHGAPIPAYAWLKRYGTTNRLTKTAVQMVETLITDLVRQVDAALERQLQQVFHLSGW